MVEKLEKNGNLLKTIINGGAVSLALVSMFFLYKIVTNHLDHLSDYIQNNTEVLIELKASIDNSNEIDKEQTQVLRSVERLIELKIR